MTDLDEPDPRVDPMIETLRTTAAAAANTQVKSPAILRAAAALMREAGRLEQRAAFAAGRPRPRGRLEAQVDNDALNAWAAKWGPKS